MSQLSERTLERAIGQIGQQEHPKGSNWGHPVQDYLSSVDVHFAAAWCMAFMYWCVSDAAAQLGLPNPLKKTAGCLQQWNLSKELRVISIPARGDIFIMDHGHGVGHTGIVESVNSDKGLNTIEGNTNDTGSREGFEVLRKFRPNKAPIIGFLRF